MYVKRKLDENIFLQSFWYNGFIWIEKSVQIKIVKFIHVGGINNTKIQLLEKCETKIITSFEVKKMNIIVYFRK